MEKSALEHLRYKLKGAIFFLLLTSGKGLTIGEITEKLKKKQPSVSQAIKGLKSAGLVRIGIKGGEEKTTDKSYKVIYPSLKGYYYEIAKAEKIELSEEDYKDIDDLFNDKDIKEGLAKELSKRKDSIKQDISVLMTIMISTIAGMIVRVVKNKPEKIHKIKKFLKVVSKIPSMAIYKTMINLM